MKRIILIGVLVAACGGAQQRTDDLLEAARMYNDGVRWERLPMAATRVPAKERDQFLDEREDLAKDLHISDYELVRVAAGKGDKATIEVKYTWFKESEGVVRETRAIQTWERHGKTWLVVDEHRMKGPEMPGLREEEDPEKPEPATPEPEQAANP
ncbi:MAG TPA: hypothetical protein VL463_26045 [Kofleriaceae bacterium]|nr:hypothetical protein [Kofleriaceae bacterium]